MAMELFVFSDQKLGSIAEWNAALAELGFEVVIEEGGGIAGLNGSWPTKLRGRDVWIEYNHWDAAEFLEDQKEYVKKERDWKYLLAFRWGSDIYAHPSVFMAAAAYAKATDGVVLDEWEPIFRKWEEVAEIARQADLETPKVEAWLREREQERNKK
jgi:hypothetical protein